MGCCCCAACWVGFVGVFVLGSAVWGLCWPGVFVLCGSVCSVVWRFGCLWGSVSVRSVCWWVCSWVLFSCGFCWWCLGFFPLVFSGCWCVWEGGVVLVGSRGLLPLAISLRCSSWVCFSVLLVLGAFSLGRSL